jgi:uncharacterized protein GlcG (DUF336 family)
MSLIKGIERRNSSVVAAYVNGTQREDYMADRLTSAVAARLIAAATARAEAIGVPMNIAVLDAGAHIKAFHRMDGAVLGSIEVAMKKAKTAVLLQINSEAAWEYCKPGAPAPGLEQTNGGLVVFAGGIPLKDTSGNVIGAIGISGGAVPQDFDVAQAAVAAFTP